MALAFGDGCPSFLDEFAPRLFRPMLMFRTNLTNRFRAVLKAIAGPLAQRHDIGLSAVLVYFVQ